MWVFNGVGCCETVLLCCILQRISRCSRNLHPCIDSSSWRHRSRSRRCEGPSASHGVCFWMRFMATGKNPPRMAATTVKQQIGTINQPLCDIVPLPPSTDESPPGRVLCRCARFAPYRGSNALDEWRPTSRSIPSLHRLSLSRDSRCGLIDSFRLGGGTGVNSYFR